jgi:hypothetical protein
LKPILAALVFLLLTATGSAQVRGTKAGSAEAQQRIQEYKNSLPPRPVKGELAADALSEGANGGMDLIDGKVIQVIDENSMLVGLEDKRIANKVRYKNLVLVKCPTKGIVDDKLINDWEKVVGSRWMAVTGTTRLKTVDGGTRTVFVLEPFLEGKKQEATPKGALKVGSSAYDKYPEPERSRLIKDWEDERAALKKAIEEDKVRLQNAKTPKERKKYSDYIRAYTEKLARHETNDPPYVKK